MPTAECWVDNADWHNFPTTLTFIQSSLTFIDWSNNNCEKGISFKSTVKTIGINVCRQKVSC